MAGPGSIAFVGFNADGNDNLAFVAIEAISLGTVIRFTENEWNGTAFTDQNEANYTWTATSAIAAGTIVTLDNVGAGTASSNLGTVIASGPRGLGASGDQVYAYQGTATAPTVFLAAISTAPFDGTAANGTLTGTGLVLGQTAVTLPTNIDVAAFIGPRGNEASFADYLDQINTASNWITQDGSGDQSIDGIAPDVPFSSTAFTLAPPPVVGPVILDEAESLAGSVVVPVGTATIDLERVSSLVGTAPVGDVTPAGRAESVAFDAASGRAYVTNADANTIDVVEVGADGSLTRIATLDLAALPSYGAVNSVAVRDGLVAVAYQNADAQADGFVALFDIGGDGGLNAQAVVITVGALPDMLTFTPDGTRILVANEGEARIPVAPGDASTVDPVGSVSIIDVSGGAIAAAVVQTIDFSSLNSRQAELRAQGTPLGVPGSSVAQNAEPEYIAISPDGTRAYVTLQETNAVAVIDLTDTSTTEPIAILPLGGVDRNLAGNAFDPSDRDNGSNGPAINLVNANVKSLLMPDALAAFAVGGVNYFITANEGDSRDLGGYVDEIRVNSNDYVLDNSIYDPSVKANSALGRLIVLRYEGDTDNDGQIEQITTYGGRGFSIFRENADGTIDKVRESGGEFEAIIARDFPAFFNSEHGTGFDTRSDNKGPEPEGVTVGEVGGRLYAFIGLERAGSQMIYDITDPANAVYVGYKPVRDGDYAPEVITFVSAEDSPTGQAFLLTANEVSGTLTLFNIRQNFNGTINAEVLIGTAADDVLRGEGGNDLLRGLGGDDKLFGGDGDDILDGGLGADALYGGAGSDQVTYINATAGVTVNLQTRVGSSGEADGDTYFQIENIDGSNFDDVLTGDTGANIINGNDGNDVIDGFGGADSLFGNDGDDIFIVGRNADYVTIDGGTGFDTVRAGSDNAIIRLDRIVDIEAIDLAGFSGVEVRGSGVIDVSGYTIVGDTGLTIRGFNGTDAITGTTGVDIIFGGNGQDIINGGDGNDVIDGGARQDILTGGEGADKFVLAAAGDSVASIRKADVITDFNAAEGDSIDFSAISGLTWAGFNGLSGTAGEVSWYVKNNATFVGGDLDGDGRFDFLVKLDGVSTLDQASVIL